MVAVIKKPLNIYLIVLLTLIDVLCWHIGHEIYGFNFFWETTWEGRSVYPLYRVFQGMLDIGAVYLVWRYRGIWQAGAMILAWYLMIKECLYYVLIGDLLQMQYYNNIHLYWLERIWFAGYWIFGNGFNLTYFIISALTGLLLLIISNFIERTTK